LVSRALKGKCVGISNASGQLPGLAKCLRVVGANVAVFSGVLEGCESLGGAQCGLTVRVGELEQLNQPLNI
jgi:hypothetical protein